MTVGEQEERYTIIGDEFQSSFQQQHAKGVCACPIFCHISEYQSLYPLQSTVASLAPSTKSVSAIISHHVVSLVSIRIARS